MLVSVTASMSAAASVLASAKSKQYVAEAVRLYEDVVKAVPTSTEARLGLASAAYLADDADRAKGIYGQLLKQNPLNVRALNDLAWVLQEHDHDYEAALELADKGLALAPGNRNLLDTRGVILSNLPGRLEDARKDFEKLLGIAPADSEARAKALLRLGKACARLKDQAAAEQYLREALRIDARKDVFDPEERSEIRDLIQHTTAKAG